MSIHYSIKPISPEAHLFEVRIDVPNPDPAGQGLSLPNWIPGSYMIRDFSRNIVSLSAWDAQGAVQLEKVDKSRWRAPAGIASLIVEYRVYAWDLSVRAAHLDRQHGFFNGTSVFLSVDNQESHAVTVMMERPDGDAFAEWQLATSLTASSTDDSGFGEYRAADYDELIDHPVEMGCFERVVFHACGVPHELVLTGEYHTDTARIVADLTRICEHQIRFFGEPAPVERYVFLVMVVGSGYGGLEHRASTALLVSRDTLPTPGDNEISDGYLQFLGLCSHEYFHTWNVKRIKPAEFVPYRLHSESHTRLLWFFEGATSYYDDLVLLRCGLIDHKRYFGLLAKTLTRVQRGAGRLTQSVTDSSFDAWNKFYKQDENAPNAIVSYYAKGALVCLCLDALLRQATQDEVSLDHIMHRLWQRWLETGAGLAETEPDALVAELAGNDVLAALQSMLYTTDELPLAECLAYFGMQLGWRERRSNMDFGGAAAEPSSSQKSSTTAGRPWLGANLNSEGNLSRITHVFAGGAAEAAGLAAGDQLVAIGGEVMPTEQVPDVLARHVPSGVVEVHFIRHGALSSTELPILPTPTDTAELSTLPDGLLASWLSESRRLT